MQQSICKTRKGKVRHNNWPHEKRMKNLKKILASLVVAGMMTLSLYGCAGGNAGTTEAPVDTAGSSEAATKEEATSEGQKDESATQAADSGEEILFGLSASITGTVPINGQRMQQGVDLAVKEINEKGGVLGKKLAYLVEDDQNVQTASVNVATKITNEKICAVIGPHSSGNAAATSDTYKNAKISFLTGGSSPKLAELDNEYLFRVRPSDTINGEVMVKFAIETLDAKKVGISFNNNDFGTGGRDVVSAALDKAGIEYVAVGHNGGDKDLTGQLMQLKSEGVDVIISYTDDAEVALTSRQLYELGFDVPVIASAGIVTQQVLDLVEPEYVENWYAVTDFISTNDSPTVADFVEKYKAEYGSEPEIFASAYYSSTYLLADAIERAGSADPEAVKEALGQVKDLVLPEGTFTADEIGDMVHGCVVAQIKDKVPAMIEYVTVD